MAFEIYPYAYPSSLSAGTKFPSDEDISNGNAGAGINVAGTLLGTAYAATEQRPMDWGRQLLSDADDGPVDSVLEDLSLSTSIRRPNLSPIEIAELPSGIKELESDIALTPPLLGRDVYYGVVLEKEKDKYSVVIQTGMTLLCTPMKVQADDDVRLNTIVIVVRGNKPNEWLIQPASFAPEVRVFTVIGVSDETIECRDEEDTQTTVAKSPKFCKSQYHNIVINDYTHIKTGNITRRLEKSSGDSTPEDVRYQRISNGYYNVGDKLIGIKVPFSIGPNCQWIDSNSDGYTWEYITTVSGTVYKNKKLADNLDHVQVRVTEDGGRITKAYNAKYLSGHLYEKDTRVVLSYNEQADRWYIVEDFPLARKVIGTLDAQLWPDSADVQVTVTSYFHGLNPGTKITAKNTLQWIGNQNNIVECEKNDEGEYVILNRKNHRRERINFMLLADLDTGSATAIILEATIASGGAEVGATRVTVYDDRGIFADGVENDEGMAEWRYDLIHYQVYQLGCSA